ncbi:BgTH12-03950 [Blumeria graminis f. sp. triticale]|uniref:BgTH12-03950 n=1 Tax=Blumeria graminis f. sp. triticale TaxID=1689686 RepID=A0A9W4DDJ3_BLUGR|nr:BgTH12-03950 [Blumeria graminis f. sp. triticale]
MLSVLRPTKLHRRSKSSKKKLRSLSRRIFKKIMRSLRSHTKIISLKPMLRSLRPR